jgi:hypothetical protein
MDTIEDQNNSQNFAPNVQVRTAKIKKKKIGPLLASKRTTRLERNCKRTQ